MSQADDTAYTLWRASTAPDAPFLATAMFTKSYQDKAERLAASLERFGVPYAIFEVPVVHRSISSKGSDDVRYSKPHFLTWALKHFDRPLLYIDSDCEVQQRPTLAWDLTVGQFDFAIYNWFADLMNDTWVPDPSLAEHRTPAGGPRYWQYSFNVDFFSTDQLLCSGCVQYWRNSTPALRLLEAWERENVILGKVSDDEVLDHTFNLHFADKSSMRPFWLPKEYARYVWWIYVQPVINHPDLPITFGKEGHFDKLGGQRVDPARIVEAEKARPFPRKCIIDVVGQILLIKDASGNLVPAARAPMALHT